MRGQAQALHMGHRADNPLIRAFSALTMLCVIALVYGAPAWFIYCGACAAFIVVLVKEPKK